MKRSVIGSLGIAILIAPSIWMGLSCKKDNSRTGTASATRSVQIFLTDDPALSFDKLFIDIKKLEIKVEDSAQQHSEIEDESENDHRDRNGDMSGGWMPLDIRPGVYDILQFRNGLDTLLSTGSFSGLRSLRKVRITLGSNNSIMIGQTSFPLTLNGNNNIIVIKLSDDFLDDNPASIRFSLDFDAGGSVRRHGNEFELQPRIRAFRKEHSASIEGKILPAQAQPVVMAIMNADTTTAKPGREGEFLIQGLQSGTYRLLVHATAGNYQDSTISNIIISGKEDVKVGTITLHP